MRNRFRAHSVGIELLERRDLLTTVTLTPTADNTLFEDPDGLISNGMGDFLFVGRVAPRGGGAIRRAMLTFDVAAEIPAGATINDVTLSLNMSRTIANATNVSLHRALAEWGEANSDAPDEEGEGTAAAAGDATWTQRLFGQADWDTDGGDFDSQASAVTSVGGTGVYEWSSAQMISDVAQWVDNPAENFGWFLLGDETTQTTAKRFDSKDHGNAANRPTLTIDFTAPTTASISIGDATIDEGNSGTTPMMFPVTLSQAVNEPLELQFVVEAGSATADEDYVVQDASVTFVPGGPLTQDLVIDVIGDDVTETDESFTVQLIEPDGFTVDDGSATGLIINDDPEPTISAQSVSIREGESPATIVVQLSNPSALEVSVEYMTVDGSASESDDYERAEGTLVFPPGETSRAIEIPIVDDDLAEDGEAFQLQFGAVSNAQPQVSPIDIDIEDNDQVNATPWHNTMFPVDVTGDGVVVPLDALLVINALNIRGPGPLPVPPVEPDVPPPFLDVNGDNILAPLDALLVINELNAPAAQPAAARSAEISAAMQLETSDEIQRRNAIAAIFRDWP